MSSPHYFYRDAAGREIGPMPLVALAQLRQAGVLSDSTLVRAENQTEWAECRQVIAVASAPTAAPTMSPTAPIASGQSGQTVARLKKFPWVFYLTAILGFFLPFVEVSCQQHSVASVTGQVLATGGNLELANPDGGPSSQQVVKAQPEASWALGLTVAALVLALIRVTATRLLSGLSGVGGVVALVMLKSSLEKQIADQGGGAFQLNLREGFWLAAAGLVAGAILQFLLAKEGQTGSGARERMKVKSSKLSKGILATLLILAGIFAAMHWWPSPAPNAPPLPPLRPPTATQPTRLPPPAAPVVATGWRGRGGSGAVLAPIAPVATDSAGSKATRSDQILAAQSPVAAASAQTPQTQDKTANAKAAQYLNLGNAKYANGDFDGAMVDYNNAVASDPNFAAAYNNRGNTKSAKGDYDGAMADYDQALALDPKYAVAYNNRGNAKRVKGDLDGAIADCSSALALDPKYVLAYNNRGNGEFTKGENDAAIADYGKAIELAPNEPLADYNRGNARAAKGDFEGAIADYVKYLQLAPENANYDRFQLALLLRRLHRDETIAGLKKAVPGWKESWVKTVGTYLMGGLSEADFLLAAVKGDAKPAHEHLCEAYYYAGMVHLSTGDLAVARTYFAKCLDTKVVDFNEYVLARAELARLPQVN